MPLGEPTQVDEMPSFWYTSSTNDSSWWRYHGEAVWTPPADTAPGQYRTAIRYDNGDLELQGEYANVNVLLSVHDVHTGSPITLDDDGTGQTSVFYTLSGDVDQATIGIGYAKTLTGTTNAGVNEIPLEWNGLDDWGNPIGPGPYPISANVTAYSQNIDVGSPLALYPDEYSLSFCPENEEEASLGFELWEDRPQATEAYITALVYDSQGNIVRTLADQLPTSNICTTSDCDPSVAHSELTWDGRNDDGEIVWPGTYRISLFAEDDAGVGCESRVKLVTVEVISPDDTTPFIEISDDMDSPAGTIYGSTNQSAQVEWIDSAGESGTVTPEEDGSFEFTINPTPGEHVISVTIGEGESILAEGQLRLFFNELSIPGGPSFETNPGEDLSLAMNSQTADTVDVTITDPFQSEGCVDTESPIPGAYLLNGSLFEPEVIRHYDDVSLALGDTTLIWDGRDDEGAIVPAGVYHLEVTSQNQYDGCEQIAWIVVTDPSSGLDITELRSEVHGTRICLTWMTNVPTYGCVDYRQDDAEIASVKSTDGLAKTRFHTVWLSEVVSGATYQYYVKVWDEEGHANATTVHEVTAGDSPLIFNVKAHLDSTTQATVTWQTDVESASRVTYRKVWPEGDPAWRQVQDDAATQDHQIVLTDLAPQAEYAFRVESSIDPLWVNYAAYEFIPLTTENTMPGVAIISPADRSTVSGDVGITVTATGAHPRFTTTGIQNVEVLIDGEEAEFVSQDGATWTFHWDSSLAEDGIHHIVATAIDDFWNASDSTVDVFTESGEMLMSGMVTLDNPPAGSEVKAATQVIKPYVKQPLDVPFYPQGGFNNVGNATNGRCGAASQQMVIWYHWRQAGREGEYLRYSEVNYAKGIPEPKRQSADYMTGRLNAFGVTYKELTKDYNANSKTDWLRPVKRSLLAGHPVIYYSNIGSQGRHIFVLTGYDPATNSFWANNTFPISGKARRDPKTKKIVLKREDEHTDPAVPKNVKEVPFSGHKPVKLTGSSIIAHRKAQGKYFIYAEVPETPNQ